MRKIIAVFAALLGAACSSGDGDWGRNGVDACSVDGQKQFVLDSMREWYLWNDLLPAAVDLSQFATPEDLLAFEAGIKAQWPQLGLTLDAAAFRYDFDNLQTLNRYFVGDELIVEVEMSVTYREVIATIQRWSETKYKGNRVSKQDFEKLIVEKKDKIIRETGMGVPPERWSALTSPVQEEPVDRLGRGSSVRVSETNSSSSR